MHQIPIHDVMYRVVEKKFVDDDDDDNQASWMVYHDHYYHPSQDTNICILSLLVCIPTYLETTVDRTTNMIFVILPSACELEYVYMPACVCVYVDVRKRCECTYG